MYRSNHCKATVFVVVALFLTACVPITPDLSESRRNLATMQTDLARMQRQSDLMQRLMKEPDTAAWYQQREAIVQQKGDKIYDKSFERVFDSLVVAMANMGAHVENMERASGYISARGRILPPDADTQLRRTSLVDYCKANGYDPDLLNKKGQYDMDPGMMGGMMESMMNAMTITLVRQSPTQTKVKLRFANVYYPEMINRYYDSVWPQLEKQIFLDKNLD